MPVFNHKDLVIKMWDSILQNDFQDWELLAIDDGSSEQDFQYLSMYAERDPRICYIPRTQVPKGAQTCRNMGLDMAHGEFIIFFDSDDWVTPFCLGIRVKALQTRKHLDFMVFPSGVMLNDHFSVLNQRDVYGFPINRDDYDAFARRILPFIVWNNIYRTDALRRSGVRWDTNLLSLQDADFNTQTLLAGLRYEYSPSMPDIGYRIDANNSSISKKMLSEEHYQSIIYAIEKFYQMYQGRLGHCYDFPLYRGVLYIYNLVMTDVFSPTLADAMVDVVCKYSPFYGWVFGAQVKLTKLLLHFLPSKRARQVPMVCHLVDYVLRMRKKQKSVKKIMTKE